MSGLRSIPNVKIMAGMVQGFGRKGDTMLAHINPKEAAMLEKKRGAKGPSYNPTTGIREFWSDNDGGRDDNNGPGGGGRGESTAAGEGSASTSGVGDGTAGTGNNGRGDNGGGGSSFGGGLRGGYGPGGFFSENEDFSREDEISERAGGVNWNDYQMQNYKEAGTLGRLGQELTNPSIATSRMGMPNAQQYGILGPAMAMFGGPVMGLAMMAGAAMGRAQTPAEQAASMAEMSERGAKNSTGQDHSVQADSGANVGKMAGVTSVAPTPTPPKLTPESWDETGFLERNPEVKNAVSNGTWASGYAFDQAYRAASGTPYEVAMTTDRNDPKESWLTTKPGQAVPYGGYRG